MGNTLTTIVCNQCKSKLLFKHQVENIEQLQILFYCPNCKNKIYGNTYNDEIKIESATALKELDENVKYTILHSGDFPTMIFPGRSMETPFLHFCKKSNMNLDLLNGLSAYRSLLENKEVVIRINSFFENKEFDELNKALNKIDFESENRLNVEIALARYNELFFLSILGKSNYQKLVNYLFEYIQKQASNKFDFSLLNSSEINRLFRENIAFLNELLEVTKFLTPYIAIRQIEDKSEFNYYSADFPRLKQFYIDIFELNCKMLPLLAPLLQMTGPDKSAFDNSLNGKKLSIFGNYSDFNFLQDILDCDLRNRLGHKSNSVDISSQKITTNLSSKKIDYSFNEFFEKILKNIELLFANIYFLISLKEVLSYKQSTFMYDVKNYSCEDKSIKLEFNFIDYFDMPTLIDFDFRYWDLISILSSSKGYSVNFNDTNIDITKNGLPLVKVTKSENSRWFRISKKKGIKIFSRCSISKIPLFNIIPTFPSRSPLNNKIL